MQIPRVFMGVESGLSLLKERKNKMNIRKSKQQED